MLNFRKLKQDFAPNTLKDGRLLHQKNKILSAKIIRLDESTIRFNSRILGNFENAYESELEVDRFESQAIHTNCDCPSRYDCQHLAALIFYLEEKLDSLIVEYGKEEKVAPNEQLSEAIQVAQAKEEAKQDARTQKELLQEYIAASKVLSTSPFFLPFQESDIAQAELALILNPASLQQKERVEFQLALRLAFRSKPLQIASLKGFLEAIRYEEPLFVGGKKLFFSSKSFDEAGATLLAFILDHGRLPDAAPNDRALRTAHFEPELFAIVLAKMHELSTRQIGPRGFHDWEDDLPPLPCLYLGNIETPLRYSPVPAHLRVQLEYIPPLSPKLLLKPQLFIEPESIDFDAALLCECAHPGVVYQDTYYRFPSHIKRTHLSHLRALREMTIPEPLFGTFVENALPELNRFAEVTNRGILDQFVTLPFTGALGARCLLSYLDGELEATLFFSYNGKEIPASEEKLNIDEIRTFVTEEGIVARNLVEERQIVEELFQDFIFNPQTSTYLAKTEKKIVEFMTGTVPRNQPRILFECPQNLLDQFIYDDSKFALALDANDTMGYYTMDLKVDGPLKGVKLEQIWECIAAKRSYIELDAARARKESSSRFSKILVLDLEKLSKLIQLFDELGIKKLDCQKEERPLWNLATIDPNAFDGMPIDFSMSKRLIDIRGQMLGETELVASPMPKEIRADLRPYQMEGVQWLERLRMMYLNGILADDMGLGKTLQAITAITQHRLKHKEAKTLIVCPTSLLYNWKEEFHKFNPKIKAMVIDGIPQMRKKLLGDVNNHDVFITSYTLLQKDIELYKLIPFTYVILDEAQHIKNRSTRNAKSVKMVQAAHRLILTGTPVENSLEDLWSLMDFLMPGFLSTFERFAEKHLRAPPAVHAQNIQYLKRKVSPFILRRMKSDVLKDLPPVSEIVYHCQLSPVQEELYRSYAASARNELTKLVERDGFDKVQIHVLATLTRLKQICCHPAIFAKEKAELGDSAKYDMLLELLQSLVSGGHRTIIFSQYTRMLQLMREDFQQRGIAFSYLDGNTKDRLEIVKEFNENTSIPVFLLSLKAGGTGLNLVGADTVIHYDMWWNPAVENQATDRVHRLGQKQSVSSYKLVTLGTIEEKIVEMQKSKKGLVKKVVSCDDEAIAKLTWEDVLELLQP